MSRIPITRVNQLDELDTAEMIQGYNDGRAGEPEPGDNRNFSFWHGWRNGAHDGGHWSGDAAQRPLAQDVIKTGYLQRSL